VQFDEPALVLDRTPAELAAVERAYSELVRSAGQTKLLVQTYFGDSDESFHVLRRLPVAGIGLDLRRGVRNLPLLRRHGLGDKFLAAGVVDGRNVWINDLEASLALLEELAGVVGSDRLIVSTSC